MRKETIVKAIRRAVPGSENDNLIENCANPTKLISVSFPSGIESFISFKLIDSVTVTQIRSCDLYELNARDE